MPKPSESRLLAPNPKTDLTVGQSERAETSFQPENLARILPGSDFWTILTGQRKVIDVNDLDKVIDQSGQVRELESELDWYDRSGKNIDGEQILGLAARELLHASWTGITDHFRIIVLSPVAMALAKQRLKVNNNAKPLPEKAGFLVSQAKMSAIEVTDTNLNSGKVTKVKSVEARGNILIISETKIKTPIDLLLICEQIDLVDPQAGKELALNLLAKLAVCALNAKNWQSVLSDYQLSNVEKISPTTESQQSLIKIKEKVLATTSQIMEATLGIAQKVTNNPTATSEDLERVSLISKRMQTLDQLKYRVSNQEKIKRRLDSLVPRLIRRWQGKTVYQGLSSPQEKQRDLERLDGIVMRGLSESLQVSALFSEDLVEGGPKSWLVGTLIDRSQRFLLQEMFVTPKMRKEYKKRMGYDLSVNSKIIDYLESLKNDPLVGNIRLEQAALLKAKEIVLSIEEQQEYDLLQEELSKTLDKIRDKIQMPTNLDVFPKHPLIDLQNLNQLIAIINTAKSFKVRKKLTDEYKSLSMMGVFKSQIIDLLLDSILSPSLGYGKGLAGWNDSKQAMRSVLETVPSTQISLNESNCAGRTILLISMLLELGVFDKSQLQIASTYSHLFLGFDDELGFRRRIEGSGKKGRSFFERSKNKIGISTVVDNPVVLNWIPLKDGLQFIYENNFNASLDSLVVIENQVSSIRSRDNSQEGLWFNLSVGLQKKEKEKLNWVTAMFRSGEIGIFYEGSFSVLIFEERLKNLTTLIGQNLNSPLLPWIKKSLLVMKRNLENPKSRKELVRKFRKKFSTFNLSGLEKNISIVLAILDSVPLPPGWSGDPTTWDQEKIWDPDLFPMPKIEDNGEISWEMPKNYNSAGG